MDKLSIIIGGSIAIVASFIGAMVAHIFTECRDRRKEFNQAAADFKSAFIPALRYLDYRYSPDRINMPGIYNILDEAFDRHEIAIIKFRPYLNWWQHIGFDKAWNDYCDRDRKNGNPHFMVYAELENVTDKIKEQKRYLHLIEILLTFAEPK